MTQPDEARPIQDFFTWTNKNCKRSTADASSDAGINLYSIPLIKAYFKETKHEKLNAILVALFRPDDPPDLAEVIVHHYTAVLSVLLHIGKGTFIEYFAEHKSLDDGHLPFDPSAKPPTFPNNSEGHFFERFCEQQWGFCCPTFSRYRLYNEYFHEKQVLPIIQKRQLGEGGSAILYQVRLLDEYNSLRPDAARKGLLSELANTFVLKTYVSKDAEKNYKNETAAFQRLRDTSHIIGYYGSYRHGETCHIILEYADRGDLERYFMEVEHPKNGEDILRFWRGILKLIAALIDIHKVRPYGSPDAPPILQGLHQDVKPQNVLVVSKENVLPYECKFKLGDLGLSQFQKLASLKGRAAIDARGTRTYGAPECYRPDDVLAAAQLPVTPGVDTWSLGCIFSEAARWVVSGKQGLLVYRQARLYETQRISNFGDGNCFHDGQDILQAVRDSHEYTKRNIHKEDTATRHVLDILVDEMLHPDPETRPTAKQLWVKVLKITQKAEMDLERLIKQPLAIRGNAFPLGPPPPPPVLPPGLGIDSRQSDHTTTVGQEYLDFGRIRISPSARSEGWSSPSIIEGIKSPMTSSLAAEPQSSPWHTSVSAVAASQEGFDMPRDLVSSKERRTTYPIETGHIIRSLGTSLLSENPQTHHDSSTVGIGTSFSDGGKQPARNFVSDQEPVFHHPHGVDYLRLKLNDFLYKWCAGLSPTVSLEYNSLTPIGAVYILSCPGLHPILSSKLKEIVEKDRHQIGLTNLRRNDALIEVDIYCPTCGSDTKHKIKSARQIEPLQYISSEIDDLVGTSIRHEMTPPLGTVATKETQNSNLAMSSLSSSKVEIATPVVIGSNDSIHGRKQSDGSLKQKLDRKIRPSYTFFADGWNLILWARDAHLIVIYNTRSNAPLEHPAHGVNLATGGANIYATVSKQGYFEVLCIYKVDNGALLGSLQLELPISTIALSSNDQFIAIGTLGKLQVYNTSNTQLLWSYDFPMTAGHVSRCQRVWFSSDGERVIAVARSGNGLVHTYVSDCKRPNDDNNNPNLPMIRIPTGLHKDFGISSTLYDSKFDIALVTAFTSRATPTLFNQQNAYRAERLENTDLGTQIQCAASPPNPSKPQFVLLNGENNLFMIQRTPGNPWELKKTHKLGGSSIFTREEMMAISMPTQNIIFAFRIQGKQRILMTIDGGSITSSDISKQLSI